MRSLLLELALGAVAGGLDILPMIIRKADRRSLASAFVECVVVALVVVNAGTPLPAWGNGLAAGALGIPATS